jgi:MscS family membrane protein
MYVYVFLSLILLTGGQQSTPAAREATQDSLGRSTPRGTVLGFLDAAHRRDFAAARQYLDTTLKGEPAEELARKLGFVLDSRLPANLDMLSEQAEGSLSDGLPLKKELVGAIATSEEPLEIQLDRVRDRDEMVWLFSAQTLKRIPAVYDEIGSSSVYDYIPDWMQRPLLLSIALWQWLAMALGLAAALGISMGVRRMALPLLHRALGSFAPDKDNHHLDLLIGPLRALVLLTIIHLTFSILRLPLLARQLWIFLGSNALIIVCAWFFLRCVRLSGMVLGRRVERRGADSTALVRLLQRAANLLAAFIVAVIILQNAGFNVTAVLAGLGVGGIAIALAAQKTLENLFGGISLIFDKPVRVGDACRFGTQEGIIEDIGLRSTRFRTAGRSVLTVPNGQLSVMNLENLGMRDKMAFQHTVAIHPETTKLQLMHVLDGIRALLAENAMVETSTRRVRLTKLAPTSIELEVFAYILTINAERFLAIQEELLLRILDVIEKSETSTVLPSQVVLVNRDTVASQGRSAGKASS